MAKNTTQSNFPAASKMAPALEALQTELTQWRHSRPKQSPIPGDLWQRAVHLALIHGVSVVSHALVINYSRLRRSCQADVLQCALPKDKDAEPSTSFVPIEFPVLRREPTQVGCTIELQDASRPGSSIKITYHHETPDIVGLLQVFWSRR